VQDLIVSVSLSTRFHKCTDICFSIGYMSKYIPNKPSGQKNHNVIGTPDRQSRMMNAHSPGEINVSTPERYNIFYTRQSRKVINES
jgi:hypothetical protein